jgi:hypothetical protein
MWAIAAPARAASIAASAISSGVTGTRSLRWAVSPAPVTAQVTKTSQFTDAAGREPYSAGISRLTIPRSMPWRLRTARPMT